MTTNAEAANPGRVAVVGSIHLDVQVDVPHLPGPGETVLGTGHRRGPGGKGANQAAAAAVAGGQVTFVARVGDDLDGMTVRREVENHGVSTSNIQIDADNPTGVAFITVDPHGANQIAVSPGASGRLAVADVGRAAAALASASVLLLQLEIPIETVDAAARRAGEQTLVVLNPAPARDIPPGLLAEVDVLVPNLVELQQLSGHNRLDTVEAIVAAARALEDVPVVVVTLGADGVLLIDGDRARHIPGEPVEAVDTTGAGDAFCGALASALAAEVDLDTAVKRANRFAAASTTRHGALRSYVE